jgi:hypothetical protein
MREEGKSSLPSSFLQQLRELKMIKDSVTSNSFEQAEGVDIFNKL